MQTPFSVQKVTFFVLILMVNFSLTGCDSAEETKKRGSVTITVTHAGSPVTEGEVRLMMTGKGEGAASLLNESGQAQLDEVVLGNYAVAVLPPEGTPDNPIPKKEYPNIPAPYRSLQNSPLKAEVKAGSNEFTFDLK